VLYINYGRLAAYLWRRHRVVGSQSHAHVTSAGEQSHGRDAAQTTPVAPKTVNVIKMLATVALLFLVAWAPYFTMMTIKVRKYLRCPSAGRILRNIQWRTPSP